MSFVDLMSVSRIGDIELHVFVLCFFSVRYEIHFDD